MALNRKVAYIDLTTGDVQTKPIPLEVRKKFIGGRGLDAYLLYNNTKKGCDPLGPGNALIISAGILVATLCFGHGQNPRHGQIAPDRYAGQRQYGRFFRT